MQLTVVDEASAAALAQFLSERDCAVYPTGSTTMDVSPLGSLDVNRLAPHLAMHLKEWLTEIPGMAVRLDMKPHPANGVIELTGNRVRARRHPRANVRERATLDCEAHGILEPIFAIASGAAAACSPQASSV